jgi:DNA-binding response OmpR family regulator
MESETGKGTTAKLYFPKAVESRVLAGLEMHESRSVVEVPRSQSGESILVVEDDEDVRQHTVSSLQELGYTVFEAVDAASASKIFEEQSKIDLLFTDLGLPGGTDGRELSERVRILRPSLKVLITTAYAASALIHDGRLDAGVELLSKPFTFEALAGRIRNVLDRGRVQENPGRILVVEDEALLRMFVAETLSDWGFQVEEAGNFHEGLDKFRKFGDSLQAAIVDLGLPDKPGDQLIREIRAVRGDLPIVLATGYASQVFCDRIAADPLLQILDKPFEPAGMAAVLRRLNVPVSGRRE